MMRILPLVVMGVWCTPAVFLPAQEKKGDITLRPVKYDEMGKEIAKQRGKVVLVDFWATYCQPCKEKFPHILELAQKHQAEGLVVITVAVDDIEEKDSALKFLQGQKATTTNLLLDEIPKVWQSKFGIKGVPCYYVFNRQGQWVQFNAENGPVDVARMDQAVMDFLKEK